MRLSRLLLLPALLAGPAFVSGCLALRTRDSASGLPATEAGVSAAGATEAGTTEAPGPARAAPSKGRALASTLGSGDLLEVRVFQEQDLSGAWRVSPDGTIDYPLCGKVSLVGMTSSQAADALTACLKAGYLRRPQVSVLVREFNSKKVFVFGEVQKPGTFPFDENMSIIQAVTLAGGFTKLAAQNGTNVTRIVDGQERKLRVPVADIATGQTKNFPLLPGDIVYVPESFF